MNNQKPEVSSSKSNTPTSSNNIQGTTKVFILSPDVLKKLGIANKIPDLSTISSGKNDLISTPVKNKFHSTSKTVEKISDNVVTKKKVKQNSDQCKPSISQNKIVTSIQKVQETPLKKNSSIPEKNKLSNSNINKDSLDPSTQKFDLGKIFADKLEPPERVGADITNPKGHNEKTIETKCNNTVNSTCGTSKNINSVPSTDSNNSKYKKYEIFKRTKRTAQKSLRDISTKKKVIQATCSKVENNENKIDNEKNNLENNDAQTNETDDTVIKTPRSRKRKFIIQSSSDEEMKSPVRKSSRQRRLSTLHTDYVTELKLHDGSSQKIPKKNRNSTEQKETIDLNKNETSDQISLSEIPNNATINLDKDVTDISQKECQQNNNSDKNENTNILINQSENNNSDNLIPISNSKVLRKQIDKNVKKHKKNIIIHENILIKPPKTFDTKITAKFKENLSKNTTIPQIRNTNTENKTDLSKNLEIKHSTVVNITNNTNLEPIKSTEFENISITDLDSTDSSQINDFEKKVDDTETKILDIETKIDDPKTKILNTATKIDDTGTKIHDTGTNILDTETNILNIETKIEDTTETIIEDTETKILDTGTKILDTGTKILDTGTKILDTGTKIHDTDTKILVIETNILDTKIDDTETKILNTGIIILDTEIKIDDTGKLILDTETNILETETKIDVTEKKNYERELKKETIKNLNDSEEENFAVKTPSRTYPVKLRPKLTNVCLNKEKSNDHHCFIKNADITKCEIANNTESKYNNNTINPNTEINISTEYDAITLPPINQKENHLIQIFKLQENTALLNKEESSTQLEECKDIKISNLCEKLQTSNNKTQTNIKILTEKVENTEKSELRHNLSHVTTQSINSFIETPDSTPILEKAKDNIASTTRKLLNKSNNKTPVLISIVKKTEIIESNIESENIPTYTIIQKAESPEKCESINENLSQTQKHLNTSINKTLNPSIVEKAENIESNVVSENITTSTVSQKAESTEKCESGKNNLSQVATQKLVNTVINKTPNPSVVEKTENIECNVESENITTSKICHKSESTKICKSTNKKLLQVSIKKFLKPSIKSTNTSPILEKAKNIESDVIHKSENNKNFSVIEKEEIAKKCESRNENLSHVATQELLTTFNKTQHSAPIVSKVKNNETNILDETENIKCSMVIQKGKSIKKCESRKDKLSQKFINTSTKTISSTPIVENAKNIKINIVHEPKSENSSNFKTLKSPVNIISQGEMKYTSKIEEIKEQGTEKEKILPEEIKIKEESIRIENKSLSEKLNTVELKISDMNTKSSSIKSSSNKEVQNKQKLEIVHTPTDEIIKSDKTVHLTQNIPKVRVKKYCAKEIIASETLVSLKEIREKRQASKQELKTENSQISTQNIPLEKLHKEENATFEIKTENSFEEQISSVAKLNNASKSISENITQTNEEKISGSVPLKLTDMKKNILETKTANSTVRKKRRSVLNQELSLNLTSTPSIVKEEDNIMNESNTENLSTTPSIVKEEDNTINESNTENLSTEKNNPEDVSITPVRRRGRPSRKNLEALVAVKDDDTDDENSSASVAETTNQKSNVSPERKSYWIIPERKKGRPRKHSRPEDSEDEQKKSENNSNRGKKRKLIEKPVTPKEVTCAVCNDVVKKSNWPQHTVKHNFLCWKTDEPPIDLKDRKLVEYILFRSVKTLKKYFKCFTCHVCGDKKKSVLGFISHLDVCQLTDEEKEAIMIQCTECDKKLLPQSMSYHISQHKQQKLQKPVKEKTDEENTSEITPRSKRKAAAKAVNLIQEVTNNELESNKTKKESVIGRKLYAKGNARGLVFLNYGVVLKFEQKFKQGFKKCFFPKCSFKSDDFKEIKTHIITCPAVKDDEYICKFCLRIEKVENVMKEHVKMSHTGLDDFKSDVSESEDDDDDAEIEEDEEEELKEKRKIVSTPKPVSEYIKPTYRVAFLAKERRRYYSKISSYYPALKWTADFRHQNYSKELFLDISCSSSNWIPLPLKDHEEYLPLSKKSMSVNTCNVSHKFPNVQNSEQEWKEYDLFESDITNDTINIFCGGPVWAFAWVPTPENAICDQYLAVSVQKDFESIYKISESVCGKEVIQFWNFGPINCKRQVENSPVLEFSLAHNHGMIWHMEWCPSGYYDTQEPNDDNMLQKLGLLALACSDGYIHIYSVGKHREEEGQNHKVFHTKPVYKLIFQEPSEQLLGQWNYQVTRLYWSKHSYHNVIAGGYSNGMVCLWDLTTESPLLKSEENGTIILKPYFSFQAHASSITALVLYPLIDEGKRWLLTGSWDRSFKYWDLNNTVAPFSIGKRGIVTNGVWITHWLCSFFTFDDVFNFGHTITTVQNPRDFAFKQCSALASNSVVMGLSSSDWASAIAQGSLAGELMASFPRTILMSYDVDKTLKCKRMMFSYNEIIDKTVDISERKDVMKVERKSDRLYIDKDDKTFKRYLDSQEQEPYVEEPPTYEGATKKYGLVFCDLNMEKFTAIPDESFEMVKQSNRLREVPTELYPITSLNTVAWNPNKQAYLYIACGYQNGFVRLRCVRFMNTSK